MGVCVYVCMCVCVRARVCVSSDWNVNNHKESLKRFKCWLSFYFKFGKWAVITWDSNTIYFWFCCRFWWQRQRRHHTVWFLWDDSSNRFIFLRKSAEWLWRSISNLCALVCNSVPTEGHCLLPRSASTRLLLFLSVSVCTHLFEPCGRQSSFSFFHLSPERSLCVCPRAGNGLRQGDMLWRSGEREGKILAVCIIAGCGPVPTLHITLVFLRKHKNSSWSPTFFSCFQMNWKAHIAHMF